MQIIYFTWKYMWNVNENCEKAKKKKKKKYVECGKAHI